MATSRSEAKKKDHSRKASKCPIIPCAEKISEDTLLSHLLSDHKELDFKPVLEAKKVTLNLEEQIFPYGQPVCIGALLYGGTDNRSRPVQSGLSQRNSTKWSYSTKWSHYKNHMAVLVMGCKTHLTDMIADEDIPSEMFNDICQRREAAQEPEKDIFVFWLIGPTTFRPVYGVLRLSDAERVEVRGDRVQIRNFNTFLIPKTFLSDGLDFLMVNRGAMNLLTGKGKWPVQLEIVVEEDGR